MPFFKKPYGKYTAKTYERKKESGNPSSYRIRSPIRSFRDLDVYKQTTLLASEIAKFQLPKKTALGKEHNILKEISKQIPKFIAESYGDKFTDIKRASGKLETAMRGVTNAIAKLDFMIMYLGDEKEAGEKREKGVNENKEWKKETEEKAAVARQFRDWLQKYQIQRLKILNLKRSWDRVFNRFIKP